MGRKPGNVGQRRGHIVEIPDEITCPHCGHVYDEDLAEPEQLCPNCGQRENED